MLFQVGHDFFTLFVHVFDEGTRTVASVVHRRQRRTQRERLAQQVTIRQVGVNLFQRLPYFKPLASEPQGQVFTSIRHRRGNPREAAQRQSPRTEISSR